MVTFLLPSDRAACCHLLWLYKVRNWPVPKGAGEESQGFKISGHQPGEEMSRIPSFSFCVLPLTQCFDFGK